MDLQNKISDLNRTVSPNDDMYIGEAKQWYFEAGENGLKCILHAIYGRKDNIKNILDIPCGYGRVLRYLCAYFVEADIVACDLNRDAVNFCINNFNVRGIYSDTDFSKVDLERKFDLIWCGSILTHFSEKYWDNFISLITSYLEYEGIVVFTVHGRIAAYLAQQRNPVYGLEENQFQELVTQFEDSGFGYINYSMEFPIYGVSLSSPAWVMKKIQKFPNLKVISFRENVWGHHDVYAISKIASIFTPV